MNLDSGFLSQQKIVMGDDEIIFNQPMSEYTTFKIGGPADVFILPTQQNTLVNIVRLCRQYGVPLFILGNGSNLLVSDNGMDGVVVCTERLCNIKISGNHMEAECGAMLSKIANTALQSSLAGLEFASGIPGTMGGAVYMNAGAYGEEMAGVLDAVTVIEPNGEVREYTKEQCNFGYRKSVFQQTGTIVLSGKMTLLSGKKDDISGKMKELNRQRKEKQPLEYPSAGSVFKRPPGHFAGTLIEQAGLKGYTVGGATVSPKHAGFIVNTGGATAQDVLDLIAHIKKVVKEKSGVELQEEIRLIGKAME